MCLILKIGYIKLSQKDSIDLKKMKTFKEFVEAVGDPLTSRNVIQLDKEAQKNLKSAMTPAGPPRMTVKPKKEPAAPGDYARGFVGRMIRNTVRSPL